MNDLSSVPAVVVAGQTVSLQEVLRRLHQRRALLPLLREAAVTQLISQQAMQAGLTVTDEELQKAADKFRQVNGLSSAEKTHAWLERQRISIDDLEADLEHRILAGKLKDHLTRDRIADYFATHQADFDRIQFQEIVVAREDLARELIMQINEGADFADLALRHSRLAKNSGLTLETLLRRQLPPRVAAVVFMAREGEVVGPVTTPSGFHVFRVESLSTAQLDATTIAIIRELLFAAWLSDRLRITEFNLPQLVAL